MTGQDVPVSSWKTLWVFVGAPGAGKSALRRYFPGAVVVSLDEGRAALSCCSATQDPRVQDEVVRLARRRADTWLQCGRDVLWDATSAVAEHRRNLVQLAHDRAARAVAVLVLPRLEVALQQNASRSSTPCPECGLARRVPEDVVRDMFLAIAEDLHGLGDEGWDEVWSSSTLLTGAGDRA